MKGNSGRWVGPSALRTTIGAQTLGVAQGWYHGAPLALSFADVIGKFPVRIAERLGAGPIHAIAPVCDLTFGAGGRIL